MERKTLNILGTEYQILMKDYGEDEEFERRDICGFCNGLEKEIVVCRMSTYKGWEKENAKAVALSERCTLRHEIVHAFLYESGLHVNSASTDAWAANEEMVDWFAIQGQKIYAAWQMVGALDTGVA